MPKNKITQNIIIFLFLFLGFVFRVILISYFPQPLIFDQMEYGIFARSVVRVHAFLKCAFQAARRKSPDHAPGRWYRARATGISGEGIFLRIVCRARIRAV